MDPIAHRSDQNAPGQIRELGGDKIHKQFGMAVSRWHHVFDDVAGDLVAGRFAQRFDGIGRARDLNSGFIVAFKTWRGCHPSAFA